MQAVQQRRQEAEGAPTTKNNRAEPGSRRKGNPGTRTAGGKRQGPKPGQAAPKSGKAEEEQPPDQPMTGEDQERLTIIQSIQEQIKKLGIESTGKSVEEDQEIERLLHGYVSMCHNAAMEFIKSNQTRASRRILHQCATFVGQKVPGHAANLVVRKGILHTIYNNLAQHANMTADMNLSIEYLEKALEAAEQPQCEQNLLPLAETYLNLANGYSFLNRYEEALEYSSKALRFAKQRCKSLREESQSERSAGPDGPNPKAEALDFQLNDFIAIMIMSELCVGEQHEKLGSFNAAIKFFSEGKQIAENNFGIKHPLYTKCINAMGGARLKSKYQTKEVYRNVTSATKTGKKSVKKKIKRDKSGAIDLNSINSEKMRRYKTGNNVQSTVLGRRIQQGSEPTRPMRRIKTGNNVQNFLHLSKINQFGSESNRSSRRNIASAMKPHHDIHRSGSIQAIDNLLFANCDSWTSMHCSHPKNPNRNDISFNYMQKKKILSSHRQRPSSAQLQYRSKDQNYLNTTCTSKTREQQQSYQYLQTMTDKKAPYKVVCKNGPTCKNHDWNTRSPLKKVCTRGPNCPNHDWDCSLYSSMRNSLHKQVKSVRSQIKSTKSAKSSESQQPAPIPQQNVVPAPVPQQNVVTEVMQQSQGGHSCMLQQTERVHQQQMQHMRVMQDDQFKMLQLVVESQHKNKDQSEMQQLQQQSQSSQNFMDYPQQQYYQPQFYNNQQYGGGYQNYYQQQQYQQPYQEDGNYQFANESETESDYSVVENVNDNSKPKPKSSEHSKSESKTQFLERACSQQRLDMKEIQNKMSQMQEQFQQQLSDMRVSQENLLVADHKDNKTIHSRTSSMERLVGKKDYAEDSQSVNDRDESVKVGGTDVRQNGSDGRNSVKLTRDVSAQAVDQATIQSIRQSTSILKPSNRNSRVAYHSTVNQDSRIRGDSNVSSSSHKRSEVSNDRSLSRHRSIGSRKNSMGQSSYISEKSFRIPQGRFSMSKREAAILIQKTYRRFRCRSYFLLVMRRQTQRKLLFKATLKGNGNRPQVLTCSLNQRSRGSIDSLTFAISEIRNSGQSQMIDVDLSPFTICDTTDMKDKVLRIIRDALSATDIRNAIKICFQSPIARELLEAEFYSESEYSGKLIGHDFALRHNSSDQEKMPEEPIQIPIKRQSSNLVPDEQRRSEIDSEIQRIRKRCEIKYVVNAGDVKVKGHRTQFDNLSNDEENDDELIRHQAAADSEDERNTRYINVSTNVAYRPNTAEKLAVDVEDSVTDSMHDYEFVIGDNAKPNNTIQRTKMETIIKLQARIRGFLIRLRTRTKQVIIYARVLKRENHMVRFTLLKDPTTLYKLLADVQYNRKLNTSTYMNDLPFDEDDVGEEFENCLRFSIDANEITELNLVGEKSVSNNFIPVYETNLFITDYQKLESNRMGEHLVKAWQLRDKYPCEIFQVQESADNFYFKVYVTCGSTKRYLKLRQLPQDIQYMAYFLNAVLQVQLSATGILEYVFMTKLIDSREFKRSMEMLKRRLIGAGRAQSLQQGARPIEQPQILIQETRKQQPGGDMTHEFIHTPAGSQTQYNIEIFNEIETKGRYEVVVKRLDDPNDRDRITLLPITEFMDEMITYLRKNMRIYLKQDGSIDYLSLANDSSVFTQKNKRRVRETLSGERLGTNPNDVFSSIESASSYRRQQSRVAPNLADKLDQFTIERNGIVYKVNVQERKNYEGKPLQITVTGMDNEKNSKYIVYNKQENMTDSELIQFFQQCIQVYTKLDEETGRVYIDFLSVTQNSQVIPRVQAMSIQEDSSVSHSIPTSKSITKARAAQRVTSERIPRYQDEAMRKVKKSSANQSISNPTYVDEDALEAEYERDWGMRARHDKDELFGQQNVILISKKLLNESNNQDIRSADVNYKILVYKSTSRYLEKVGEVSLSIAACIRLLQIKPSDMNRNSSQMTIEEMMRLAPIYSDSELLLLEESSGFAGNELQWQIILENVVYVEDKETIKFDIWNLCQSREYQNASSSKQIQSSNITQDNLSHSVEHQVASIRSQNSAKPAAAAQPMKVNIAGKLGSNRKPIQQRQSAAQQPAFEINSAAEMVDSQVDGGNEGVLGDSFNNPRPSQVMKRNEYLKIRGAVNKSIHQDSDQGQESGFEDGPKQSRPSIIRTETGQFYSVQLFRDDNNNFQLSVFDKQARQQVCNKQLIPQDFVNSVHKPGFDKLEALQEAINKKIKLIGQITTSSRGQLNIFSQNQGSSNQDIQSVMINTGGPATNARLDRQDSRTDGGDISQVNNDEQFSAPKLQVVRKSTYYKKKAAAQDSDAGSRQDQDETKTRPSIVRTLDGDYYQMQIFMEGEQYCLTMIDKKTKGHLCNKKEIPQDFISSVPDAGFDKLQAVQEAISKKIKSIGQITISDSGQLNIFSQSQGSSNQNIQSVMINTGEPQESSARLDRQDSRTDGGDISQVVRKSTYQKQKAAAQDSDAGSRQGDERDLNQDETKTRPSIVRTLDGDYYQMQVFVEGEQYFLTMIDKKTRFQLCDRKEIPQDFTSSVPDEGFDQLDAVKKAIEAKLKDSLKVKTASAELNLRIFSD